MNYFEGKNILVAGGTGLIGRPLVELLRASDACLRVVSLDDPIGTPNGIEFIKSDLREFSNCIEAARGMDVVFNLTGVKGSPAMANQRPASFMVPTVTISFNLMEAARREGVERYLYTSSVGVYAPAKTFREDDVWKTFPSSNDRFAGWAKRIGELQAEAYRIEHGWEKISIVRPANVYGPFDNFDPENAMVIPSLIHRSLNGESPLKVWGDGTPVRDFIHSRDVAFGMMLMVQKGINEPVNLGSGTGFSIREVAETIVANLSLPIEIDWDITKPAGDKSRLMDTSRADAYGFSPQVSLNEGIADTISWYRENKNLSNSRYNPFTEKILRTDDA